MTSNKAKVLWFTGLSGSGKTTISIALKNKLEDIGKVVDILDGDVVRNLLHNNLGFSREDIRKNNRLIAELAKKQLNTYDFILVPIISPYKQDRIMARNVIGSDNFIELFVKTPLEECIARDPKGLYKKALSGKIENFIGISDSNPYEEPDCAEIVVDTSMDLPEEVVRKIFNYLTNLIND